MAGAILPPALGACDEQTTTQPEGEPVPAGLVVEVEGTPTATVDGAATTGELFLATGSVVSLAVTFLDDGGAPFDVGGASMSARVVVAAVASYTPSAPGAFSGELRGRNPGSTSIRFTLTEGGSGSGPVVYISPPVPVHVAP